jgi:hypothetical protein
MEWINAAILVGLVLFAVYQKNKIRSLEKALLSQKEILDSQGAMLASHKDMIFSQKEMLSSQKDLLTSYKDALDDVKAGLPVNSPVQPKIEVQAKDDDLARKQREDTAEEKVKFEKEVQQKKKNMDWYEKEFTIALDTLLELFLHIPHRIQQPIIAKMPNSVIKKGFKRLSNKI